MADLLLCTKSRPLGTSAYILESIDDDSDDQINHPEIDDDDSYDKVQAGPKVVRVHRAVHPI
jgi:hypothetical protein